MISDLREKTVQSRISPESFPRVGKSVLERIEEKLLVSQDRSPNSDPVWVYTETPYGTISLTAQTQLAQYDVPKTKRAIVRTISFEASFIKFGVGGKIAQTARPDVIGQLQQQLSVSFINQVDSQTITNGQNEIWAWENLGTNYIQIYLNEGDIMRVKARRAFSGYNNPALYAICCIQGWEIDGGKW